MVLSESGRYFLPNFYLKVIFTFENIEKAVKELRCATYERIGLTKKIFGEAIRLFAILIKCGEEDSIIAFREHSISDTNLPLRKESVTRVNGHFGSSFAVG